jgi:hypothetical protein
VIRDTALVVARLFNQWGVQMRIHAILFALLTGLAGYASAQATSAPSQAQPQPPFPMPMPKTQSPEEIRKLFQSGVESSMGAMVPVMTKMSEAQVEFQLTIAERPETAERIATFKKNLFDALRRKGFTAEESITIVSGTSLPSVSMK